MAYQGKEGDEREVKQPLHQNEAITAQMISIVSARLKSLQTTARNRMHGLECDLRVDSDYCSKLVPPYVDLLDSRGAMTAKSRVISTSTLASNQAVLEGLHGSDDTAQTQELNKKKLDLHKGDNRRNARSQVEKQLQVSIESHITRTVESYTYELTKREIGEEVMSTKDSIFMNTNLLLIHTYERFHINFRRSSFKQFLLSKLSGALFEDFFWLVFCHFFQRDSLVQQRALADAISAKYVKMITTTLSETRDNLLCIYPYAVASGICFGFYYLFPASRHLYTVDFKTEVYLFVCQLLLGLKMTLRSVQTMRRQYFPEAVVDDFATRTRPLGKLAASASAGAIFDEMKAEAGSSRICGTDEKYHLPRLLSPQVSQHLAAFNNGSLFAATRDYQSASTLEAQEVGAYNTTINNEERFDTTPRIRHHQQRAYFNTSQLSPLMEQYFRSPTKHVKKDNFVLRTTPSADCVVGGVDTFHKFYQRKMQKYYADEAQCQHERYKREVQKEQRSTTREIAMLHEMRDLVLSSGKKGLRAYCTALMSRKHSSEEATTTGTPGISAGILQEFKW